MKAPHVVLSLLSLVAVAGCLDLTANNTTDAQIRIVNATGQFVNIFIDNGLAIDNSAQLNVSLITTQPGTHTLGFRDANGNETPLTVTTTPGSSRSVYGYTQNGVITAVLLDTAPEPAANQFSVRFLNLSHLAGSIDANFAHSDGSSATTTAAPFAYLTKTAFMSAASGSWQFYTTIHGTSTKVYVGDAQAIGPGERRTYVLIDSANVPTVRILPD